MMTRRSIVSTCLVAARGTLATASDFDPLAPVGKGSLGNHILVPNTTTHRIPAPVPSFWAVSAPA